MAVSKHAAPRFDGEKLNLRKLNKLEVGKKYNIEVTNRFAALENLSDDENINMAWEKFKDIIKTAAKESLSLQEWKQQKTMV